MLRDSWCSPTTKTIDYINPGAALDSTLCTYADDTWRPMDFTPPVAVAAVDGLACTDVAPSMIYSIDQTGVAKKRYKIQVDSETNQIWTMGRTGND